MLAYRWHLFSYQQLSVAQGPRSTVPLASARQPTPRASPYHRRLPGGKPTLPRPRGSSSSPVHALPWCLDQVRRIIAPASPRSKPAYTPSSRRRRRAAKTGVMRSAGSLWNGDGNGQNTPPLSPSSPPQPGPSGAPFREISSLAVPVPADEGPGARPCAEPATAATGRLPSACCPAATARIAIGSPLLLGPAAVGIGNESCESCGGGS